MDEHPESRVPRHAPSASPARTTDRDPATRNHESRELFELSCDESAPVPEADKAELCTREYGVFRHREPFAQFAGFVIPIGSTAISVRPASRVPHPASGRESSQAIVAGANNLIAWAGRTLEAFTIDDLDMAMRVLDEAGLLQHARCDRHARATNAEHER